MNVLVYSADGVARTSLNQTLSTLRRLLSDSYAIISVDAKVLAQEPWEGSTALLVMPGGRDLPYVRDLAGVANRRIIDYVTQRGGRYLGLCAGGYYGSSEVEFEKGQRLEVLGSRELKFFPGKCVGTMYPGFVYDSERGAKAVPIKVNKDHFSVPTGDGEASSSLLAAGFPDTLPVYYNGGGFFEGAHELVSKGVNVLATYVKDAEGNPSDKAAVVSRKYVVHPTTSNPSPSTGVAVLTGIHPEYDPSSLDPLSYNGMDVVGVLRDTDHWRLAFMSALLRYMGLKPTANGGDIIPPLSPLFLSSSDPAAQFNLFSPIVSLRSTAGTIKDSRDTFIVSEHTLDVSPRLLPTAAADVTVNKIEASRKESSEDDHQLHLLLCTRSLPQKMRTPLFDHAKYYSELVYVYGVQSLGRSIMYGEAVTSTQTILDKNLKLQSKLPSGVACVASRQLAGLGRGRNPWISPVGSVMFSLLLRHPLTAKSPVIFIQYLAALAVVEAVRTRKGYQDIPLRLKWPNDIYAEHPDGKSGLVKIGGVLVNFSITDREFTLVIGIGVNTTNERPTTSINHLIDAHNQKLKAAAEASGRTLSDSELLAPISHESLLASIMSAIEEYYKLFTGPMADGFRPFEATYYKRWLHSNKIVTLGDHNNQKARIDGISSSYGLLKCVAVDDNGRDLIPRQVFELQPDGNSFDMMRGLVARKTK
ncbi:class II aaRS and biotin synthetase [Ramicandelaber brevisporus]|nr:class II aaRS and biotin synthetase [Ramicandelaber brevisporus]